jgi:two-component system response regulator PilR (NtrC family)
MESTVEILVVDDEKIQRETLGSILRETGYHVAMACDVPTAFSAMRERSFDIIITDFRMPGGTGLDIAEKATELSPSAATLIITAYADVESVIEAMRIGVVDYIPKPLNIPALLAKLKLLVEHRNLKRQVSWLRTEINRKSYPGGLMGDSPAIAELRETIDRVADTRGTVLITGESGTGKEVVAREIHRRSRDSGREFVAINCGALPENLLESELFGHKKGAFTGATSEKLGLFAVADGGTLFLDEIGEMPRSLQVKLLRAIQEREFLPVGETRPRKVDLRIIAATNRNLGADVANGLFRHDLYYRINVIALHIPALRHRIEDIPVLAKHFADKYCKKFGKSSRPLSNDAIRMLMQYSWPGNVRELENAVERAVILGRNPERIEDQDFSIAGDIHGAGSEVNSLESAINQFARAHISHALERHHWDKRETAKSLQVSLASLYRKMEELKIHRRFEVLDQ